ncbi:MAG: glycosyltransferase family 1 protein [Acidobacteria bacterium]|nr:MAG: glycosyltransferase family 1 protein [Acidobacteriota bacterium]
MRPLRIGVNALYLIPGGVGGTEIYLRHLLAALAEIDRTNQYYVFTNLETGADLAPKQANFTTVRQRVNAAFRPARIIWEQTVLPLSVATRDIDVLLNPGFTAPLICGRPQVTVFHDLQHKRHPEYFRWFDLPFWRTLLFWSAQLATLLIAVSEATRADLENYYRLPREKIRVVPEGVTPRFSEIARARPASPPEPFLLTASTLHPHKNLDRLLRVFTEFRRTRPEYRLVITGVRGFDTEKLEQLRVALGLAEAVEFTGWIDRDKLFTLFERAWAFVYPSNFEGFGLPVLEALAAGVPTACTEIEPLASMAGEAALLFDPSSDAEMLEALVRITSDEALRTKLTAAGPERAALFSWTTTARLTLDVLLEAARPSRSSPGDEVSIVNKNQRPGKNGVRIKM